ncbi:MAG: hypothetical protein ACTSU3_00690 [Candidatus Thorarchaeota archaeon]
MKTNDAHKQNNSIDWTLITQFTSELRQVNVRFRVLKKGKTRIVTQRASGRRHKISDCLVGDSSAIMNLTLWNEDIDIVEFDRTYELLRGYINLFDECMILSRGRRGELTESHIPINNVNEQIDMSRPFMGKPKRRKRPRSATGRSFQGAAGREAKGYCSRKSF